MSKSRLEKFLYALYSLDSSDLPTPLSRIEELYKCLVTGEEAPTFEPLSRVEKYLMAILGGYDIDSLPNPLSRVEVLLYKLATGDDNLDDVKSFLSEHEELLAEIIRNGGVGGNIDIEYVLYTLSTEFNTLYNTAEKPVKSAILKGQTLVNRVSSYGFGGDRLLYEARFFDNPFQNGETLTIFVVNPNATTIKVGIYSAETGNWTREITYDVSINKKINYIVPNNSIVKYVGVVVNNANDSSGFENSIVVVNGDQSHLNINTYFDGMQSVKMPVLTTTGKNLFNYFDLVAGEIIWSVSNNVNIFEDGWYKEGTNGIGFRLRKCIKVKPNTKYYANFPEDMHVMHYKANGDLIKGKYPTLSTGYLKTSSETHYINFYPSGGITSVWDEAKRQEYQNCYISESEAMTPYEPYKSNILTVNEEVELRGIGNVKDELDCLTGEVTERIGEIVLNGNENWVMTETNENTIRYYVNNIINAKDVFNFHNDSLNRVNQIEQGYLDQENLCIRYDYTGIGIRILKTKATNVSELKSYLFQNPITIQYISTEKSIKTVDLSTVNQDGNNTKLSTFNDITYVTLSSEGLIPEAELEVATKNKEVLSTMSLEMNDISTTQNALQETSDIQSENVDATMIATTEIYEGLL